jgi:hypothetical protein
VPSMRASALDTSLAALIEEKEARAPGGRAGPGGGGEAGRAADDVADFGDLYSPIVGAGTPALAAATIKSATRRVMDPPELRHLGGDTWTTRKSYSLANMGHGRDMVREGALQARFTYRMGPRHDTDLNEGFVSQGTWGTMNFRGDTKSPQRRPLAASPVGAASELVLGAGAGMTTGAGGARAGQSPSSPGFVPTYTTNSSSSSNSGGRAPEGFVPPVLTQKTAFGKLLEERAVKASSYSASPSLTSSRPSLDIPLAHRRNFASEMSDLDQFDREHDMGNPTHWPKKVLRAKIAASGVSEAIGMSAEALERADKAALLAAYERIPATKRLLAMYSTGKPAADGASASSASASAGAGAAGGSGAGSGSGSGSATGSVVGGQASSLDAGARSDAGSSLHSGYPGAVPTNVFIGLTDALSAQAADTVTSERLRVSSSSSRPPSRQQHSRPSSVQRRA